MSMIDSDSREDFFFHLQQRTFVLVVMESRSSADVG